MPPKKGKGKKAKKADTGGGDDIKELKRQLIDDIHNAEDIKDYPVK